MRQQVQVQADHMGTSDVVVQVATHTRVQECFLVNVTVLDGDLKVLTLLGTAPMLPKALQRCQNSLVLAGLGISDSNVGELCAAEQELVLVVKRRSMLEEDAVRWREIFGRVVERLEALAVSMHTCSRSSSGALTYMVEDTIKQRDTRADGGTPCWRSAWCWECTRAIQCCVVGNATSVPGKGHFG